MAAVSFPLTVGQDPSASFPAQSETAAGPQANATQGQGVSPQQDTVTLAGRAAESQANQSGGASTQFGEAAAFFFAERQSFRASNGSGGNQSAQPSAPSLPVKLTDEGAASGTQTGAKALQSAPENGDVEQAPALAATVTNGGTQSGDTSAANAATASSAATSQTPIAELSQLDETLQQIGINPQSISLFNRMAMLLYANDPAALKALVQSLQTGAQQLATASPAETSTAQSAAAAQAQSAPTAVQADLAANTQDTQIQEVAASQGFSQRASLQQASASDANTSGGSISSGSTSGGSTSGGSNTAITTTGNRGTAASSDAQGSSFSAQSFSAQLEELQFAFAAIESQQLSGDTESRQAGQLLNVSA